MKDPGLLVILAYDGLCTFEYSIAVEVFALQRPGLGVPWYRLKIASPDKGPLRGIGGVVVHPDGGLALLDRAQTIVVPGWRDCGNGSVPPALCKAIVRAAARGARLLSLCSGAFVLAAAGVLDGRRAATHWLYADDFKRLFPRVAYADDVLYVDDGNIITSAGCAAGLDACLHLVRRDFGAHVANKVARRMVIPPHREGGQAQYVEAPVAVRPHHTIGGALDWARKRLDRPIAIAELAAQCAMSNRTFLRQFREAMGMTPKAWLQRERMVRARELLECGPMSHGDIATRCGYESPETFRVAFRRIVGASPGAYRARFAAPQR